MRTIGIRELAEDVIATATAQGNMLGITNMGALVGVLVPLTKDVMRSMAYHDAADVQLRARAAEDEMASGQPMSTVSEFMQQHESLGHRGGPTRVGIRNLSGSRIEEAAQVGETLLVSSGRVTLALLIPVTPKWLESLVESKIRLLVEPDSLGPDSVGGPPELVAPAVGLVTPRSEVPPVQTTSGREILLLRAIGIRIIGDPPGGGFRLFGTVTDMLAHEVRDPIERDLPDMDEGQVYAAILELIDDLYRNIGPDKQLIGVGLEVGGHVRHGRVVYSANAFWHDFPLADRLNAALGLPVVLENDANALAILERRFNGISDDNVAVVIITNRGVGCGLIVDGRLFRGAHGMAGELGHVPLATGLCRCGNADCLECAATPYAISENLEAAGFKDGYETAVTLMTENRDVEEKFQNAGTVLGRGAATIIDLLNPSAMVFYGPAELVGPSQEFFIGAYPGREASTHPYLDAMVAAIRSYSFSSGASGCRFIIRRAIDNYSARAAAACLINWVLPTSQVLRGRPVIVQSREARAVGSLVRN